MAANSMEKIMQGNGTGHDVLERGVEKGLSKLTFEPKT